MAASEKKDIIKRKKEGDTERKGATGDLLSVAWQRLQGDVRARVEVSLCESISTG